MEVPKRFLDVALLSERLRSRYFQGRPGGRPPLFVIVRHEDLITNQAGVVHELDKMLGPWRNRHPWVEIDHPYGASRVPLSQLVLRDSVLSQRHKPDHFDALVEDAKPYSALLDRLGYNLDGSFERWVVSR